jgi:glycosyltransferase involved in cell wall biosynthesis
MTKYEKKVSICCLVYNHGLFLDACISGFLSQECNFDFEIVVGEDCSTDKSREILLGYSQRYPNKFNLILNEENIGIFRNFQIALENCTGKYIAICDGDDYWTDPYKLQKQVDFLEANNSHGLVYTNYRKLIVKEYFENDKEFRSYLNLGSYFQDGWPFLFTGSWLMKNEIGNFLFLDNKYGNLPSDVQILCHVLASKYQVHYHNETTGVYRILEESASHSLVTNKDKDFALVRYLLLMKYKNHISKHIFTEQLEILIQNKFQYFESFKLRLIDRIALFVKVTKIKGVNRASRFIIYNVS